MKSTPDEIVRILRRHSSAAISIEEARELLGKANPGTPPPDPKSIASISSRDPQLRLLSPARTRWAGTGPQSWILLREAVDPSPERSIEGRLRRSLRRIGETLEPGSIRELARWERQLREERKVRRALRRRLRSRHAEKAVEEKSISPVP